MRLLLDTHVLWWALVSPERLSRTARDLIADPDNAVFVSAITICEIAVKHALGKRSAPPFSGSDAIRYCLQASYSLLDLTGRHAAVLDTLPPLHNDPFDRLLIAQALSEPLRLVTHDAQILAYGVSGVIIV